MSEIKNWPLYLIKFDDTEVPDETMFGAEVANKRFEQISGNWNAHLFVKVASNSRDDACSGSNAKLASDYDVLAAQFDSLAEAVGFSQARCEQAGDSPLDCAQQLAAQRDEGLAREAELRLQCGGMQMTIDELQQRLVEAVKLLTFVKKCLVRNGEYSPLSHEDIDRVLGIGVFASPGCADGEKAEK